MKFQITLNMPAKSGNLVHQIIGEHEAESLREFTDALNDSTFVTVVELYKDTEGARLGSLYAVGEITLNTALIGKVKAYVP
jgi:hypothetical protein